MPFFYPKPYLLLCNKPFITEELIDCMTTSTVLYFSIPLRPPSFPIICCLLVCFIHTCCTFQCPVMSFFTFLVLRFVFLCSSHSQSFSLLCNILNYSLQSRDTFRFLCLIFFIIFTHHCSVVRKLASRLW